MRRLVLIHLVGNALLLWLGYEWLGVGESTIPRLLWSGVLALAILTGFCALHGATFAYFRGARLRPNLVPIVVLAIGAIVLYALVWRLADYSPQPALKLASYLTLKFRKPVKPATVQSVFNVALWLVRWVLLPLILLPVASGVAARGWRGCSEWRWRGLGWLLAPVLLLCGLWLPFVLLGWVPHVGGFWVEMVSFVVRIGAAYLLFVAAAIALEFVTSRWKPGLNQAKTVASV